MRFLLAAVTVLCLTSAPQARATTADDLLTAEEKTKIADFKKAEETQLRPTARTEEVFDGLSITDNLIKATWHKKAPRLCGTEEGISTDLYHSTEHYTVKAGSVPHEVTLDTVICSNNAIDLKTNDVNGFEGSHSVYTVTVDDQKPYQITGSFNTPAFISNGTLYIVRQGCCGEGVYFSSFDVISGKIQEDEALLEPFINEYEDRKHD